MKLWRVYENDYYNTTHTISSSHQWNGWFLDRLGIVRIRGKSSKKYLGITPILRSELRERNLGKCYGKLIQWLRENIEQQEKTIDDRLFSDAESRRDEWNRLKPFFDEIMTNNEGKRFIKRVSDMSYI